MIQYTYATEIDEIQDGDYTITTKNSLYCLNAEGPNSFLGNFKNLEDLLIFLEDNMYKTRRYPNIFIINDHGNVDQLVKIK